MKPQSVAKEEADLGSQGRKLWKTEGRIFMTPLRRRKAETGLKFRSHGADDATGSPERGPRSVQRTPGKSFLYRLNSGCGKTRFDSYHPELCIALSVLQAPIPTGGAGMQADLQTFALQWRTRRRSPVTALTIQDSTRVHSVLPGLSHPLFWARFERFWQTSPQTPSRSVCWRQTMLHAMSCWVSRSLKPEKRPRL